MTTSLITPRIAEDLYRNHSLTTPRVAEGLHQNHSLTTPRVAEGFSLNHSLTTPRIARGISIGLVLAGLSLAPPALAQEGHGSCAAGPVAFHAIARAGQLDDLVVPIAQAGQAGATEAVLHDTYCAPRP